MKTINIGQVTFLDTNSVWPRTDTGSSLSDHFLNSGQAWSTFDNVQSKLQSPHHLGIDIPHPKTASNHWYQFYNLINQTIYNLHCPARRCRLVAPTDVHKPVIDLFLQPNAGLSSFPVKILFTFVQLISPANLSTKNTFHPTSWVL